MKNIQEDYSNNRYFLHNKDNFLILRELKLKSPNNCAKIINCQTQKLTAQKEKYKKYHPILLWINTVIQQYSNIQNLSLNDKIYFILNDLVEFKKRQIHQRTYNILDLFPNYDGIDKEQIILKQLMMEFPNKWSQLLIERNEYKYIYEYIQSKTPKLSNKKYTMITKCYWIFNNIQDFPKCKVDNKQILKNVRSFIHPCYDTCCKKCGQIFAGWKRVKRNDYDYNQILKAKNNKFYLKSILESDESIYKTEYLNIINKYKANPIKHFDLTTCIKYPNLYSEKHHIIPKWYFIANKIQIDNSDNNLVRVSYEDHVNLHFLLVKHFEIINDKPNFYKAVYACKAFYKQINSDYAFHQLSVDKLQQLKLLKIQADHIYGKTHSGKNCHLFKWDKKTLKNMLIDFIESDYNLSILKEKYNYTSGHSNFRALLKRNKIAFQNYFIISQKINKFLPTEKQYKQYLTDYQQLGFEAFQKKYNYPNTHDKLLFIFNQCKVKYR